MAEGDVVKPQQVAIVFASRAGVTVGVGLSLAGLVGLIANLPNDKIDAVTRFVAQIGVVPIVATIALYSMNNALSKAHELTNTVLDRVYGPKKESDRTPPG